MSEQDDILRNNAADEPGNKVPLDASGKQPGEDMLMAYAAGTLTPQQQREVEMWLSEEGMESDAVEGLKMIEPSETKHSVHRINHNLHKALGGKRNKRRKTQTNATTIIAIILILLLTIVAWLVIKIIS